MEVTKKRGLTAAHLKGIAMLFMFIDHLTAAMIERGLWRLGAWGYEAVPVNRYLFLRILGRLSFPIFCFFIAEGYRHTRSKGNYLVRLLAFGLLSELPFDWALFGGFPDWGYQNVYFTLALGLLSLILWDAVAAGDWKTAPLWRKLGAVAAAGACVAAAELLKTDYGAAGVLTVLLMYLLREQPWLRNVAVLAVLTVASSLEIYAFPFCLLLMAYNGERGRQWKSLFYVFYPAHLLLLAVARWFLMGV